MPLLELHKNHGPTEGSVVVTLASEPPETHVFSKGWVDAAVKEGWAEFAGKKASYKVDPDPLGEFKDATGLTLTSPGDKLVLHLVKDDSPIDVVYRITHYPVPRGFRYADDREPDGIRIAPEYGVELEA